MHRHTLISIALIALSACGTGGDLDQNDRPDLNAMVGARDTPDSAGDGPESDATVEPADGGEGQSGAALYARHCVECHGPTGEGVTGPPLTAWAARPAAELADRIARTMPARNPAACDGPCADAVAAYVLSILPGAPADCADAPTHQRVRLLSHREYVQSVEAVLFPKGGPCPAVEFELAGHLGAATVHVAGDFNDWAPTVAAGGWATSLENGAWRTSRALQDGRYRYKFVIDETEWVPAIGGRTEPDGFGGVNSVVEVACSDGPAAPDVLDLLPSESRPEAYPFDNHAATAQVDTVRFEAYLATAERYAQTASRCADAACFERRLAALFRRGPTDAERARYGELFEDAGDEVALQAALASPAFLYRTELSGTLSSPETATALAYFLWGAPPDEPLLDAELATPQGRAAAARRLLDDPRGRRTIAQFASQWLEIQGVVQAERSPQAYPNFDPSLRPLFLEETQRFVGHIVFGSGRFADLLTSDYTLGDPRLAAHYGLEADGERLPYQGRRSGLLGHASILSVTAHSDQSSPIRRGLWVRRALLCQTLPAPPANAGGVPEVDATATTRERFRQHTDDPFCASCHQYIDDVGFGFEHFDAVGAWRTEDAGQMIDAQGDMNDVEGFGTETRAPFSTLPELAAILAESEAAADCFVTQVYRFAHGRAETDADACALDDLRATFRAADGDIPTLLAAVAAHPSFVLRSAP